MSGRHKISGTIRDTLSEWKYAITHSGCIRPTHSFLSNGNVSWGRTLHRLYMKVQNALT